MKNINLAVLGFGNAGRGFAELLLEKAGEIKKSYDVEIKIVAIATKSKGTLVNEKGIDLPKVLEQLKLAGHFDEFGDFYSQADALEVAKTVNYDVLVELTPLNIFTGQPAIDHIEAALKRRKDVITANKGPIAWKYKELKELAEINGSHFYYETTVMDGTPVFNLAENNLKMCKILEISGIFNSTTNFILDELEKGKAYGEVMKEGRQRGFVEADSSLDIEGWDSAAKTAALINVLMDANLTPKDIIRKGIEDITLDDIKGAARRDKKIKLVCRGYLEDGKIRGKVWPEEVDNNNIYACISGTSSIISIKTDLMGTVTIIEEEPEIMQTAYGIFSDLLRVVENNS